MRCACLLSLLALVASAGYVKAQTVTLDHYRSAVRRFHDAAGPEISRTRKALAAAHRVRMPGGALVDTDGDTEIDTGLLLFGLDLAPRGGDAATQAREIVAAPEYRTVHSQAPTALEKRLDAWYRAFIRWLEKLGPGSTASLPTFDPSGTVRVALFVLAGVIGVIAWTVLWRRIGFPRQRRRATVPEDPNLADPEITDPLRDARAAEAQHDYRTAVRLTYIAALQALRDARVIALKRDKTNEEYQRSVDNSAPQLGAALQPVTRLFDRIWYGESAGCDTDLTAARGHLEAVLAEIAQRESNP